MKYLVFDSGEFTEFSNWGDVEYFILDKPKARYRKITSKKAEDEFRKLCKEQPEFKQKIYVVINGDEIKRFSSWKECKEHKDRYPDSKYKSFTDDEEAQQFINTNMHGRISSNTIKCSISEECASKFCDKQSTLYTLTKDGNYLHELQAGSYSDMPSIERECNAIIDAIEWAVNYNEECILVEYRNLGSEMWANGTWNANKEFSKKYQKQIAKLRNRINIEFRKHN